MSHVFNDIVFFNRPGIGVIPGIVLSSRLEQQADNSLAEVLTLLYAHPDDEKHAPHHAKEIGSTQFGVKPLTKANAFGWSDSKDMPLPVEPEPEPVPETELPGTVGPLSTDGGPLPSEPSAPVIDPDTPAPEHEPAA